MCVCVRVGACVPQQQKKASTRLLVAPLIAPLLHAPLLSLLCLSTSTGRTSRPILFRTLVQWMAPEEEARWKLGHMTASKKAVR